MEIKKRLEQLSGVIGHIQLESDQDHSNFKTLNKLLQTASMPEEVTLLKKSDFSIENSDLFFRESISKDRIDELDQLANKQFKRDNIPSYRVFVREVPIREPLLHASVPEWGAGAKVSHSIGPFKNKDGRQFWFDFFPVKKLIALYLQGESDPVLLFNVIQRDKPEAISKTQPIHIALLKKYNLAEGDIWINARYLAANAPAGSYTGLAIKNGTVTLSSIPVDQNGKLTVSGNTNISVDLALNHKQPDADNESPYGIDARDMQLSLPDSLSFHFSAQGRAIDNISDAKWKLYEQSLEFEWSQTSQVAYDPLLRRITFPFTASETNLQIRKCKSPFNTISHTAEIIRSAWTLPVATIDITQPTETDDTGAMMVQTGAGLLDVWQGLETGGINLTTPVFLVSPGQIFLGDFTAGNPHASQSLALWQDEMNPFGSRVDLSFPNPALFFYVTHANGNELFMTTTNADFQIDRPVKVDGEPPAVRSLNSILLMAVSNIARLIYLFDDNLIQDSIQLNKQDPVPYKPMALALSNALFRVSKVNGCLLFGTLSEDFNKVDNASLFMTFGLHAYLPTLPDPYAANLGVLERQIRGHSHTPPGAVATDTNAGAISAWLVCRVQWQPPIIAKNNNDEVNVSFHFAPLSNQFGGISFQESDVATSDLATATEAIRTTEESSTIKAGTGGLSARPETRSASQLNKEISSAIAVHNLNAETTEHAYSANAPDSSTSFRSLSHGLPDYDQIWEENTGIYRRNMFALLDVSTNADLYGVSFNLLGKRGGSVTTHVPATSQNAFPFQIKGMDVISQGLNVKAFTVPQISWEPLLNLTPAQISGDPPAGLNYYPNDGGAMQILNNSSDTVALAPLPLTNYLLKNFADDTEGFAAYTFMTLPFGLKALAVLQNQYRYTDPNTNITQTRKGTDVQLNAEEFENNIKSGLQLQLDAGEAFIDGQSDMFVGSTLQLNNVLDFTGAPHGSSTLGRTVTKIFNDDFLLEPFNLIRQPGVPLTRIDLSGYGASTFSNWLDRDAAFAKTSQAKFDVMVGRCAHEVIQVVSIIYPWGIKVVRTITIFRVGSGYVYRHDSGWRAESNGEFDFRYFVNENPSVKTPKDSPFEVHPGIVKGLYNITNIIETEDIVTVEGVMDSDKYVDENGLYKDNPTGKLNYELQPVYFDADIEIDHSITGFTTKKINGKDKNLTPSKKILGYVQAAPRGIPINEQTLKNLIIAQMGSIGGPIDCEVDLAESGQKMRLNRFDFNNAFGTNGSDIIFAAAGRGNVLLPKDGSWTMVKHDRDTGEVSPVPSNLSVPVIREGKLIKDNSGQKLDKKVEDVLLRIANPSELLRPPVDDTLNYGFVQNIDTQKALLLTPAFEVGKKQLFSKTPPLFADAFRIVNSKSIFPNIGNAENNIGDAILLNTSGNDKFNKGTLLDHFGESAWKLLEITGSFDNPKELGYRLLKKKVDTTFDLPNTEFELINLADGNFRIYIEYKQKDKDGNDQAIGHLDFDINSMANNIADNWKSKMENIALVIDLAGIDRLMTIKGKWDSQKGSAGSYPKPELVFSSQLQPVIDILEILQQLQGEDYDGAIGNGLKLAMSNKADTWEYKFEASKEIPVLRFPVPDAIYNDPNTPFKLEAGLTIGAYYNAAIKVTNDANELLPSAGALVGFYGRLSVMCVSLSAATVYAIGQVNLDIVADTKMGSTLPLRMKFGFGAQIVIGLPVAGNVSVLYMVGIEIVASSGPPEVSAFMLFEGHAEILGGLVSITIRIEAMGTVSKKALPPPDESRTDLACQVTFGLDISIFLVININFETSWSEQRQIA